MISPMTIERLAQELDARNVDNVTRTESYLELYARTHQRGADPLGGLGQRPLPSAGRARSRPGPPTEHSGSDLPWLLMAHLVSRNAGYMMTDLAGAIDRTRDAQLRGSMTKLFVMLERANYLIFHDAWHHVCAHLMGQTHTLRSPRTPVFMCRAWERHEAARERSGVTPALERALVFDLVHNEQHLIERRVVHRRELRDGLDLLRIAELFGLDRGLILPWPEGHRSGPRIAVGRFADLRRRIATGQRLFDLALADPEQREAMFQWALAHPHTGSRQVYGGRPGPTLREVWPLDRVRALVPNPHAEPEEDPDYD